MLTPVIAGPAATRVSRWLRAILGALCFGAAAALLLLMSTLNGEGEWLLFPVGILIVACCVLWTPSVALWSPRMAKDKQ